MVTVKVFYEGLTKRAKMPLRDMVPEALEQSVRAFLQISDDATAFIERYSDSAAAYVLLQEDNAAVYKQLYRAAKAKSKLKLRVTVKEDKPEPKAVTVEDEPETAAAEESTTSTQVEEQESESTPATESTPSIQESEVTLPVRTHEQAPTQPADSRRDFENRLQVLLERNTGFASHLLEHQQQLRAILGYASDSTPVTASKPVSPVPACPIPSPGFAVCCNNCEAPMPDAHYHCSTCDDGDFDLCISCVESGKSCYSNEHWLIKRSIINGSIITSTTEKVAPKQKVKRESPAVTYHSPVVRQMTPLQNMRTCNQCIKELPEKEFLHCDTCPDFDLCQRCFGECRHGHHPKHGFVPAVEGTVMPDKIKSKMAPGRNQMHYAICDGCDKYINGIRHKCLDCPDWDYCSTCMQGASTMHAKHRFVPIYEPLTDIQTIAAAQPVHVGICCDGPLCSAGKGSPAYIRGTRYKCAVCHDLDFCATCEASPANEHNKTHPLIKFRTPVRHVSVTTTGERQDGKRMPTMGDRRPAAKVSSPAKMTVNSIQTVVNVKPACPHGYKPVADVPEPVKVEAPAPKHVECEAEVDEDDEEEELKTPVLSPAKEQEDLRAVFVRDSVVDGTILPPNHVFEQTWVLRNEGKVTWPAGCSVKFVGGDYMGHVDSAHPAGISELVSASESTVCYTPLAPGQEFAFTVLLRTPVRLGKIVSYWRLATPEGLKFGHRLWVDVNVRQVKVEQKPEVSRIATLVQEPKVEPKVEEPEAEEPAMECSTMIFPKLEKESPVSSMHEAQETETQPEQAAAESDEYEDCGEEAQWDVSTDDGFMTDEEYDILDASDDEYLSEQGNRPLRK
jgi:next-to-BRCA1 protein 1